MLKDAELKFLIQHPQLLKISLKAASEKKCLLICSVNLQYRVKMITKNHKTIKIKLIYIFSWNTLDKIIYHKIQKTILEYFLLLQIVNLLETNIALRFSEYLTSLKSNSTVMLDWMA